MVSAQPNMFTRKHLRAALTNNNVSGFCSLPGKEFNAQEFWLGVGKVFS